MSAFATDGTHPLVVLLIEDEFFVRCDIADCLREAGYAVVETSSGEEAIALCDSDMAIDLVFTDINLIGTATGWDVGERFQLNRPDVPMVYTSGEPADVRRCIPRSIFVPKPYKSTDILDACWQLRAA
jgi:CheY-like chemotaxis protein